MARYNRPDGRSTTEGYTTDAPTVDDAGSRRIRINQDAANTFPDSSVPEGRSTGPNLSEDSPISGYSDLYASENKIEEFKFLECDPLVPLDETEPCPICRPNPYAYVPDYRMMEDGEVYFDGKNCTQNIVFTFNAPPSPKPVVGSVQDPGPTPSELKSKAFQDEQINRGIRLMLDYFNKADTATAYMYVPQPPKTMLGQVALAGAVAGAGPAGAAIAVGSVLSGGAAIGLAALLGGTAAVAAAVAGASVPEKAGYNLETKEIDCIKELTKYAEFDFSIPIQLKARTRVLISIPVEQLYRVPDILVSEPEEEFLTNLEVCFDGREIVGMSNRAHNAFKVYNNELKRWRDFEGGSLVELGDRRENDNFNLEYEGQQIVKFVDRLGEMLDELGFSLNGFKVGKQPERIVIKFREKGKDKIEVHQILVNLPGCPIVKVGKRGKFKGIFNKYAKKASWTRTRTLHYIGTLPEIDIALTARTATPWLEVVTSFTYPAIRVKYGTNSNTTFNNPTTLACFANSAVADSRVDDFFEDVGGLLLDAPNLMFDKFGKFSCYDPETLKKNLLSLEEFENNWNEQNRRVYSELKNKLSTQEPVLNIIFEELFPAQTAWGNLSPSEQAEIREGEGRKAFIKQNSIKPFKFNDFFERLNDRLGRCGWINLVMRAIDCVAQGLGEESATKALAEAAFNAMEDAAVTRSFLGMSPETQLKVIGALENELGSLPAPWETAKFGGTYEPGSYTGAGFSVSPLSGEDRITKEDLRNAAIDDIILTENPPDDPGGFYTREQAEELLDNSRSQGARYKDFRSTTELQEERNRKLEEARGGQTLFVNEGSPSGGTGTFGAQFDGDDFTFNDGRVSQGSGGSYGAALGSLQKQSIDALRNAMLKNVGADELLQAMERLPGAPIISQILKRLPCRQTPLISFEPRLDSFLSTLEFDFCQWDADLKIDLGPEFGEPWNIILMLLKALKDAILETLVAIAMQVIKLILEKILSIACDALALLGANLLDLFSGNNHFRDLLKENMCPDASMDDLNDALKDMFTALGGPEASCLETLTSGEMGRFIDDLSLMLTQGQIIQLLQGNPTSETINLAVEVARTSGSECIQEIFTNPDAFTTFFPSLGIFLPDLDELADKLSPSLNNSPIYPCPPETVDQINNLRCQLLEQKGLSAEECREQLDDIADKAIQDLQDLAKAMQEGPFANTPPLESDQSCPGEGFFPNENPLQDALDTSITKTMFETIEKMHLKDMWGPINMFTGKGGFLNGIMSDTWGRPFKRHNWQVEHFGSPLAADLGFFEYHCDNAIRKPDDDAPGNDKVPIDINGKDLIAEEGGKSPKQSFGQGYAHGGYPPTIGAWMSKKFRDMEQNLIFDTTTSPRNFDGTIAEAIAENERRMRVNEKRIDERLKYIEGWIKEFDVEDKKAGKKSVAAQDLRIGATRPLFSEDTVDEEKKKDKPKGMQKNSPEYLAREVLLGKQILGGMGAKGNTLEKKIKKSWGTNGKVFIDYYGRGDKHKLLEMVDTSSADIVLKYDNYLEEKDDTEPAFSYTVEYDYNLVDQDTVQLLDTNKYQVKVMETWRSIKDKGLTKKELKKLGAEGPVSSIYQPGNAVYTFPRYQFEVTAQVSDGVRQVLEELEQGAVDDVKTRPGTSDGPTDAYEIEAFYRYFRSILLEASEDRNLARELMDSGQFRLYFNASDSKKNKAAEDALKVFDQINESLGIDATSPAQQFSSSNSTFDTISSGFINRISTLIATGDTPKGNKSKDDADSRVERKLTELASLDNISRGFRFGYDPEKQPKVIYLDPAEYGGPLGRLFPDLVPPPFYVKERRQSGWMDICDVLVPEVSGCEPYSKSVYNLEDLQDLASELKSKFIEDQRLQQDPLCSQEAPYDKILYNFDASNIEAAMRAIIRIYAIDVFLRSIPTFVAFGFSTNNYDDLLLAFVVERLKLGLQEDGARRTGASDVVYYYRFLEQAVNNTKRKIDSEVISLDDLSQEEQDAFNRIVLEVRRFYQKYDGELEALSDAAIKGKGLFDSFFSTSAAADAVGIGYGSSRFNKSAAKLAKDRAFKEVMERTESDALILLRRYIREEFEMLREKFEEIIPPIVDNVDHLFVLSPDWIRGAATSAASEESGLKSKNSGPYDVMSDPNSPSDYVIEAAPEDEYWPFILERYVKIHEKNTPSQEVNRAENLYNIVNINDWGDYVKSLKSRGVKGDISDLWGNPDLEGETSKIEEHTHTYTVDENGNGITSTHVDEEGNEHYHEIIEGKLERANLNPSDDGHKHEIDIIGWSFGLRICYMPDRDDEQKYFSEIMKNIKEEEIMNNKAYVVKNRTGNDRYLIPIASVELPIPDQKYDLYNPETYDVVCLIQELIKSNQYQTLFKYIFPLPRFISLLAVYCSMGFTSSIGNVGFAEAGGDLWEKAGGRKGKGFRKWDHSPSRSFDRARQAARNVFEGFYEGAQNIDFDTSNDRQPKNGADTLRDLIRPKVNFEDGLRWWERGLRVKGNPYNSDGDEC